MSTIVAGDMYEKLDGQLFEIKRQIRQPNGYPHDLAILSRGLQDIIEGKFSQKEERASLTVTTPTSFEFPRLFKVAETNLNHMVHITERFAKEVLGVSVNLCEQFDFPVELPWKDVLLVYDPGLNNREAVAKSLRGQKLKVYDEGDNLMNYYGSAALGQPTLRIIENSIRPTEDTLGSLAKSPDGLNADGRPYLDLRGYALAFGLRYFAFKDYLDPQTWTWFPRNRLPAGGVAYGSWNPGVNYRWVKFDWRRSGYVLPSFGARLAISLKLHS